jgi:hypothetical protein
MNRHVDDAGSSIHQAHLLLLHMHVIATYHTYYNICTVNFLHLSSYISLLISFIFLSSFGTHEC